MTPESKLRQESHLTDYADILQPSDGSEPPVIVAGHAVNLWSMYFLAKGVSGLSRFLPFTSKDLDLVGTADLLERLHRKMKGKLSRSEPRSPVIGRLVIPSVKGQDLTIEVLHMVKGLDFKELERTIDLQTGDVFGRVLMPHLVLKAKIENSVSIDQTGRNDAKHVDMMILCVRAFIADLADQISIGDISPRTVVNLLGEIWEIVTDSSARKASEMWGFDFTQIWPFQNLMESGDEKTSRWLQHRFPDSPA